MVATAQRAKDPAATRFCMAAARSNPKDRDLDQVCDMVRAVKDIGMETCVSLGMLTPSPSWDPRGIVSGKLPFDRLRRESPGLQMSLQSVPAVFAAHAGLLEPTEGRQRLARGGH